MCVLGMALYLRKFREDCAAILAAKAGGSVNPSLEDTVCSTLIMSDCDGAETRIPRQRERTGSMTLLRLFATRIRRQVAVYFSMVRRRAACASLVSLSTSESNNTFQVRVASLEAAVIAKVVQEVKSGGYI
jgi:hypothetical protein